MSEDAFCRVLTCALSECCCTRSATAMKALHSGLERDFQITACRDPLLAGLVANNVAAIAPDPTCDLRMLFAGI